MNAIPTPTIVVRPKLARWMFERDLKLKDAVEPLGVGLEQVRRYCLPFGDSLRTVPSPKVMERVIAWTAGEVTADDFFPARPGVGDQVAEAQS